MAIYVDIEGAENWIKRSYLSCGEFQWVRETYINAKEAGATYIEYDVEWQAVKVLGVYRMIISDNGSGMSNQEILEYFSKLGRGGKPIGGVHENFGIGAKVSLLPWNQNGVTIISYKNGIGSMIHINYESETGKYRLLECKRDGKPSIVVLDPDDVVSDDGLDWSKVVPDFIKEQGHGTSIILHGSDECPNTLFGNPKSDENKNTRGITKMLNSRLWEVAPIEVRTHSFPRDSSKWPKSKEEALELAKVTKFKLSLRSIFGAKYYVMYKDWTPQGRAKPVTERGDIKASGTMRIHDNRVLVEWYLWEGGRPDIGSYALEDGFIAVRYKGELHQIKTDKPTYRMFGIMENKIQKNLTIILEPAPYDGKWGIFPDDSRNSSALRFIGKGDIQAAVELPIYTWSRMFSDNMPIEILEEIKKASRNENIITDDYKKTLLDRFGKRWRMVADLENKGIDNSKDGRSYPKDSSINITDPSKTDDPNSEEVWENADDGDKDFDLTFGGDFGSGSGGGGGSGGSSRSSGGSGRRRPGSKGKGHRKGKITEITEKVKKDKDGNCGISPKEVDLDIPDFELSNGENFEEPWHIASWSRHHPKRPTVFINIDSPFLVEARQHYQSFYPAHYADDVGLTVNSAYGAIAVAKIAHFHIGLQHLSESEIDAILTEHTLTCALGGILGEEGYITEKLKKFGRRITASPNDLDTDME